MASSFWLISSCSLLMGVAVGGLVSVRTGSREEPWFWSPGVSSSQVTPGDFPEVCAAVFSRLNLKASQGSSSWIRSRVSVLSEEGAEAWTQTGSLCHPGNRSDQVRQEVGLTRVSR